MRRWFIWLAGLLASLSCLVPPAQAQTASDYTQGVVVSGSTATIWFKATSSTTSWVDAHYSVNSGAQQNLRMTWSAGNARYETPVSPVATGNTIGYFFTYNKGAPAYDTPSFSFTVGSSNPPPAGIACFYADINYAGASTCASTDSSWVGSTWNDRISSVKVTSGNKVVLYGDVNYGGASLTLTADTPNLVSLGFNDAASSYKINPGGGSTGGPWNGNTTFNIVNQTNGRWSDSQVYWSIIGRDWNTNQFVHVGSGGQLIPMAVSDNGALNKNGVAYSNYFFSLSQVRTVTIPPINSARLMLSVGSPMYIQVNIDGAGNIAYAGANIENPSDPNLDVYFDFGEFAILPLGNANQGIFINTTRVDQFGFPLKLRLQGNGGFDKTVGEPLTESRDTLFSRFISDSPAQFKGLAQAPYAPYRIVAPSHATFLAGKANANYLQAYIDQVWSTFRSRDLVFNLGNGWPTFTGRVSGDTFAFNDGQGTYYIRGKPTTSMVFLGNGLLNDATGAGGTVLAKQLQLQAQLCAALNRHVAEDPANWYNQAAHYPAGSLANWYAKFWHDHSLQKLAYGFPYDDVGNFSPSLHTDSPTIVTYTVGW